MIKTLILGAVQGLCEFLPVSSSGHLAIFQIFMGFGENLVAFDILLHFATLLAVVLFFWRDIMRILSEWFGGWVNPSNRRSGWAYRDGGVGFRPEEYCGESEREPDSCGSRRDFHGNSAADDSGVFAFTWQCLTAEDSSCCRTSAGNSCDAGNFSLRNVDSDGSVYGLGDKRGVQVFVLDIDTCDFGSYVAGVREGAEGWRSSIYP